MGKIKTWRAGMAKHGGHYDPNQPRVPAGDADGGQWTAGAKGENAKGAVKRWKKGTVEAIDQKYVVAKPPKGRRKLTLPKSQIKRLNKARKPEQGTGVVHRAITFHGPGSNPAARKRRAPSKPATLRRKGG